MADQWFYTAFGATLGPVSFETLVELAHTHLLSPTDSVRKGSAGEWILAESIVGLIPEASAQDTLSGAADTNLEIALDISEFQLRSERPATIGAVSGRQTATREKSSRAATTAPSARVATADADDFELHLGVVASPVSRVSSAPANGSPGVRPTVARAPAANPSGRPSSSATPASSAATRQGDWFARAMGFDLGPMPLAKLVALAQSGGLKPADRVRPEANEGWLRAADVPELQNAIDVWGMLSVAESADEASNAVVPPDRGVSQNVRPAAPSAPSHAPAPAGQIVTVNGQRFVEVTMFSPGGGAQRVLMPVQFQPGAPAPGAGVAPINPAPTVSPPAPAGRPPVSAPAIAAALPGASPAPAASATELSPPAVSNGSSSFPVQTRQSPPQAPAGNAPGLEDAEDEDDEEKLELRRKQEKKRNNSTWFCRIDGVEHGPVRWLELQRTAQAGRLKRTDLIRKASGVEWKLAETEPELFQAGAGGSQIDLESLLGASPQNGNSPASTIASPTAVGSQGAGPSRNFDDLIRSARIKAASSEPKKVAVETPDWTESLRANGAKIAVVAGVLAVLAWFFLPSKGAEKSSLIVVTRVYEDFKALRERKASPAEWTAFEEKVKVDTKHLQSKESSTESAAIRYLKSCVTRYLPKMVLTAREAPTADEESFKSFLVRAESAISGKPVATDAAPASTDAMPTMPATP